MLPLIYCWPLWDEVIRRKFLFSCIFFPTQPCCFIKFTRVDMCFKSDDLYYVKKSSHSTDLSKHCLLTYGNKIVPVAGADICVWQPHALGDRDSLVPFLFETNNNKITMLLSERGLSVFKCLARQLWRGSTSIKKRCLQPGGSWEPHTQAFGVGGPSGSISLPERIRAGASDWKSNRHPLPLILIRVHRKRRDKFRQGENLASPEGMQ